MKTFSSSDFFSVPSFYSSLRSHGLLMAFCLCKSTSRLRRGHAGLSGNRPTLIFVSFLAASPRLLYQKTVRLALWFSDSSCSAQRWASHDWIVLRSPAKPLPRVQCPPTPLLECSMLLPISDVKCTKPSLSFLSTAIMKHWRNSQGTGAN